MTDTASTDGLPPLSVREQRLVEALGAGKGNSEAYRYAYGAEGYNADSLKVVACKKVSQPHIQQHLAALRSVGFDNAILTRDAAITDTLAFAARAEADGAWSAAASARQEAHRLAGLHIDRVEVIDRTPRDVLTDIAAIAGPDVALLIARQNRIATDEAADGQAVQ